MKIRSIFFIFLLILVLMSGGCRTSDNDKSSDLNHQLDSIVRPFSFNMAGWILQTNYQNFKQKVTDPEPESVLNADSVITYFDYQNKMKSLVSEQKNTGAPSDDTQQKELNQKITDLKPVVEQTLANQIRTVLAEQDIYNPSGLLNITFPPVTFKLQGPLYTYVVSPRDKIERIKDIIIRQGITVDQMEEMESASAKLGVSALVIELGGLGATYPSFVIDDTDVRFTIDTATEEWLHQYLAFKPLGFHYVLDLLGISQNADIPTINETAASMTAKELGKLVYDKYYAQYFPQNENSNVTQDISKFDFNQQMRIVRLNVDKYLAEGKVEQAENYMNEQRQYIENNGYYIRKLNQAYFAFYGSYADSPTSIDPIGENLKILRQRSTSIKGFLDIVSGITSREDLPTQISKSK